MVALDISPVELRRLDEQRKKTKEERRQRGRQRSRRENRVICALRALSGEATTKAIWQKSGLIRNPRRILVGIKEHGFVSNPSPSVWRDRRLSYKTYMLFKHLFLKTEILGLWVVRRDEGPPPVALVKLRELLDLTPVAMALKLGLEGSMIHSMEAGDTPFTTSVVDAYCDLARLLGPYTLELDQYP
jgi:hypothetical protein